MLSLLSLAALSSAVPGAASQSTLISLPVTYYLPSLEEANSVNPDDSVYYFAKLCAAGVAQRKQAVLHFFVSENPGWNTVNKPYVVAQVSVCENNFEEKCVIATNYRYTGGGSKAEAHPEISWTVGNETEYFIRAMGGYKNTEFSMELSFTDGLTPSSLPYSTDIPFRSHTQSKPPVAMEQYWKTSVAASVTNGETKAFALAYCDQGTTISSIDVAVSAMVTQGHSAGDFSLFQQWACPQTIAVSACTYVQSMINYWYSPKVATFNLLPCREEGTKTTKDGIWVIVSGNGANLDSNNTFVLNADTTST